MARPATVATAATKFLQINIIVSKKVCPITVAASSRAPFLPALGRLSCTSCAFAARLGPDTHAHNRQDVFLVQFLARVRLRACRIDDAKPDSRLYSLTKSWGYGLGNELMPEIMGRL
ncbi:hypothetical protein MY1884_005917 [Beauveria asiatica]